MIKRRQTSASVILGVCALLSVVRVEASGVPIGGFLPFVGISLTDEYELDNDPSFTFYQADLEPSLVGNQLGLGSGAHYDLALLDTGAAASLITTASDAAFDVAGEGFRGTETLTIGGATGFLEATINDAMSIFATGLGNRTGSGPLTLNNSTLKGQSSISLITIPEESDLPNVLGIPFSSQFATYIRSDQPQIFQHEGRTVRTPQIEFLPLGSGGQGITRRAPITLDDPQGFSVPPAYVFNFNNLINGDPLTDNPQAPTVLQASGAFFLSANVNNDGESLSNTNFFFDTGADITVVSELNAVRLGFDPVLDEPEFTVAVVGSGGVNLEVPGFFVDQFTIQAVGGNITLSNVPVVVLDVVNPAHPGNIVEGIIGTNLLAGRNVVIDPKPALGGGGVGPSLYISDPVTTEKNWTTAAANGTFGTGANWNGGTAPTTLSIANVRHVSGGNQTATVAASTTVWELNVSGGGAGQSMTVAVQSGATLTTFSGVNIEQGGVVELQNGGLDTQFVEILGGTLRGSGTIQTGSGPIPGQVENRGGTVAPGVGIGALNIDGRFANGSTGTVAIELGGTTAGTQHDQLAVTGAAAVAGTLSVSLADLGGGLFTPNAGNSFTLLTATEGVGGVFDTYLLPNGFVWNVLYGEDSVTLNVIGVGISGDFNLNGTVDASDYVVWRNGLGTTYQQADYKIWRANFGMTAGSGSGAGWPGAVPEPASGAMLLVGALLVAASKRNR